MLGGLFGKNKQPKAVQEFEKWVAHPMEWGVKPRRIDQVLVEKMRWPYRPDPVEVYLIAFTMPDGEACCGMAGPTNWSFRGMRANVLSREQAFRAYAGWYLLNFAKKAGADIRNTDAEQDATAKQSAIRMGMADDADLALHSKVSLHNVLMYSVFGNFKGEPGWLVFELSNIDAGGEFFPFDAWAGHEGDALYYLAGCIFLDGQLNAEASAGESS